MAMLERSEWYDLARATNWSPRYVSEAELYPDLLSDPYHLPAEGWERYDEPYKVAYREYVRVQREKDAGVYSVKAALARSNFYDQAGPEWLGILKLHYGAIPLTEYAACQLQGQNARFGRAGSMRNMATFGMLDEMRHSQLQLFFPHELLARDRQFDWAHEAHHTRNWLIIGGRHCFDDVMMTRDVVTNSIMTSFIFETGFTNLQMVGLAADAESVGDFTFANLITSVQSDEARHAQLGMPLIDLMVASGKKADAQRAVDIGFWRLWRVFAVLTGIPMDYYIPLAKRHLSFKEFMHEWVIRQFDRQLKDLGLERPWYWQHFLDDIEVHHHIQQGGVWSYRPTMWWHPVAGVGPEERAWLDAKYPGWNASFGHYWDTIIDSLLAGREDLTQQKVFPPICNICQIPIANRPGPPWKARAYQLEFEGRRYHFCTPVCRWIFETEPERYRRHESLVDMLVFGRFDPPTPETVLRYMGIGVISEGGRDSNGYRWVEAYRGQHGHTATGHVSPLADCALKPRGGPLLYVLSRFEGDGHVKTVEVDTGFTMDEFARYCAQFSVGHHAKDQPGRALRVRRTTPGDDAPPFPPTMRFAECGPRLMDSFDVYFKAS
jgi:toluene monooxygenase system protein A